MSKDSSSLLRIYVISLMEALKLSEWFDVSVLIDVAERFLPA